MFKDRLKALRAERGFSQRELAKVLDISQQAIASWEVGRTQPDIRSLGIMSQRFGVSVDYLLGKTENKKDADTITALSTDEKIEIAAKNFLKLICRGDEQAASIIETMHISASGEVVLPDADEVSQAVVNVQLRNFIEALKNAKRGDNGKYNIVFEIPVK